MNKPDDWRTALVTFAKTKVTAIQARRGALEKKKIKEMGARGHRPRQ